jgi:hypothetical protein
MEFTVIQPNKIYRYLLVVVFTFPGWMKAYPTHTENAAGESRTPNKKIIPWFGVSSNIGSGNGPAFVSQVIKGISHHLQRL